MRPDHRIAIVHDWLVRSGGAERVLGELLNLFPRADLYVLFHLPGSVPAEIESRIKGTSFIQKLPGLCRYYTKYLPLFPKAVESLPLSGYDLVITSSYCVAKGARANHAARNLCYCHTPMRYVWHQQDYYTRRLDLASRTVFRIIASGLRRWDQKTSMRPDVILANSRSVAARIKEYYRKKVEIVYPPVDAEFFRPGSGDDRTDNYLTVGALVPYKNFEIAVAACEKTGRKLLVAGDGPEGEKLRRMAGANVFFLGWQTPEKIRELYRTCRALIVPGEEDFGLVMAEAQACGCPVIALRKGGAEEIVISNRTGIFFDEPSPISLEEAIIKFERMKFDPVEIRMSIQKFHADKFRQRMLSIINHLTGD